MIRRLFITAQKRNFSNSPCPHLRQHSCFTVCPDRIHYCSGFMNYKTSDHKTLETVRGPLQERIIKVGFPLTLDTFQLHCVHKPFLSLYKPSTDVTDLKYLQGDECSLWTDRKTEMFEKFS